MAPENEWWGSLNKFYHVWPKKKKKKKKKNKPLSLLTWAYTFLRRLLIQSVNMTNVNMQSDISNLIYASIKTTDETMV